MTEAGPLEGPYVEFVKEQVRTYWDELTARYRHRYGVDVPLLTHDDYKGFAETNDLPVGTNLKLAAALSVASSLRPDVPPDQLLQLLAMLSRTNPALQLQPQPIEILDAISTLRPPPDVDATRSPAIGSVATRQRGRPGWTGPLFHAHLNAAARRAEEHLDDPTNLTHLARHFENLHGDLEVDVGWLRKLKSRFPAE